jgi:hypothetical protein
MYILWDPQRQRFLLQVGLVDEVRRSGSAHQVDLLEWNVVMVVLSGSIFAVDSIIIYFVVIFVS